MNTFSDYLAAAVVLALYVLGAACVICLLIFLWVKGAVLISSTTGEAELKKAEWTRQIAVKEALAKKDSAVLLAQAEVERAKGVARANKIIGDSLKGNEGYLQYLWIDSIHQTQNQIIYVPTENGLPVLEANRLKK